MQIPVILDHEDFIIINKPTGIGMHQEGDTQGVVEIMKRQTEIDQLWLVHRLDKVTSGCLILAKSANAAADFGAMFAERQLGKYYLAISDKKPNKKQGAIIGDMAKSRNGTYKLLRSKASPAKSQFFSCGMDGLRLFLLKPATGKTHQLRVAMKSLGSSILGDRAYSGSPSDRAYLHAFALDFHFRNQHIQIIAMPNEGQHFLSPVFSNNVERFANPWALPFPAI